MLGTYTVDSGELVFRPRYPLAPGMRVRAVFRGVGTEFDLAKAAPLVATTRVAHIYPSADVLPENALKFYVFFSASMQKGDS
jgi:hypothetical protein